MDEVTVDLRNGVLWITLNRPAAMNALTPTMLAGIDAALDAAEADGSVRVVVLTGAGRAFCVGADLKYLRSVSSADGPGATDRFLRRVFETMDRLERLAQPVIAVVNGWALAGGLEFVLCCDLVMAARSAKLGDAHANYGLLPGGGGSVRLPRKIGPTRAKYLMFTGEFVAAESLVESGLVNRVVEDDELTSAAAALAATIASKSPVGLRRMKQLVNDGLEQPTATALRLELLASEAHAHSGDMAEGLAAFEEKRVPVFRGR